MKQKIILYSICLCLFFACKKDKKTPDPDTKLYPISFNVSGFSQTNVPTADKAKTNSLTIQATDTIPVQSLYYAVYVDRGPLYGHGPLVTYRRVLKGDQNFGQFKDNLPAGTYQALFCGGSNNLIFDIPDVAFYYNTHTWDDTFYKVVPFTVTSGPVNQSVVIPRRTAKLSLVIKDAIPTGTSKIVVHFSDSSSIKPYYPPASLVTNQTTQVINATDAGKTNYTFSMNTLNDTRPFDVTVDYYGPNPVGPLGTKIIKNVVCKPNTRTILSGYLFTQDNGQFTITVNQDWNPPVNVNF